jgi:cardiolipin synthase
MSARIITLPNLLTVFRMALIPVFVSLLFYQKFLLALAAFVLAGITDGLDGLFARRFHQQSPLGRILDPVADKLMLVTSFVVLSMKNVFPAPVPHHLPIPFWVTITVISREVFILVGAAAINVVTGFRDSSRRFQAKSTLWCRLCPSQSLFSLPKSVLGPVTIFRRFTQPSSRSP